MKALRHEALRGPVVGQGDQAGRWLITLLLVTSVLAPVGIMLYQSFLDQPFFDRSAQLSWGAFAYVLSDPDFYQALETTVVFSIGLVALAVPLGTCLAFLMTRTNLPGRRWLEPLFLAPIFLSSVVLAFGYTITLGPAGLFSLAVKNLIGFVPWNIYSVAGMVVVAGLNHVPYVYLYTSRAMNNVRPDVEEAARVAGGTPFSVALSVTIPLVMPAILFSVALNLLLGFETFGIPLVLGDPNDIMVLTTYIYKLTILLGVPSYQLMAAVAVIILLLTLPLVAVQRRILSRGQSFATIGGKGLSSRPMQLSRLGTGLAFAVIGLWLFTAFVLPIGGVAFRSFVSAWGIGINPLHYLTLDNFRHIYEVPELFRAVVNTLVLAVFGGGIAVALYTVVGLVAHRWRGAGAALLDYTVLLPRALPGLVIGLAFFWIFLFFAPLRPIRRTLFALLIGYSIVGLSYGLRLIQSTLMQIAPELEEVGRTTGATLSQVRRHTILPLIWPGVAGAWVLIFLVFLREYATGIYLMGSGTEVVGAVIVSLLATGDVDTVAALSFVSIGLTALGLALALRVGVRLHD